MCKFSSLRKVRTARQQLAGTPEEIFPLLCPTREYEWIEHWACEMLHSDSGFAEPDCVFTTGFPEPGGRDTWVVCRHEPPALIEFIRINSLRVMRYTITLTRQGAGRTGASWQQVITAMNEEGNELVRTLTDEAFEEQVGVLEACLNHYLQTGQMLSKRRG
jgi:hypothetical protein